jgi:CheY-like chemotaxis protein
MACPPTVLVVDDHPSTLNLYGLVLEMMGCSVMTSESAPEALRIATRTPPNVVVTDFAMPGMDGIQLCEALKAHPATEAVPVVMVSGQIQPGVANLALAAGCTEVLSKPCLPEELFAAVKRAWDGVQAAVCR